MRINIGTFASRWRFQLCLVLALLCTSGAKSQTFTYKTSEASGIHTASQIYHHGLPDTITVWCNEWTFIRSNLSTWGNSLKLKSKHSFVKFSIDHYFPKTQRPYTYRLAYQIYGYYNPNDTTLYTLTNDTLTISNFNNADPHNAFQDIQIGKYSNYYKTKVIVTQIYDYNGGSPIPANLTDSLRWNFNVESSILTQEYNKAVSGTTYYGTGTSLQITKTPVPASNYLDLQFNLPGSGAGLVPITPVNYELEWTYIDDYQRDISSGTIAHAVPSSYDFAHNNTRVWLDSPHYRIPLVYPSGYLVYRVRMVRPDSTNFRYPIYSDWSYSTTDAGGLSSLMSSHPTAVYQISSGDAYAHDSLNWQYTVSFAEGGRYKHVLSFYDGLLKNRESITRFNSTLGKLIVTKNVYDFEGRPSIKTLPAPVSSPSFSFQHNVDLNSVTGLPYKAADFDTGFHICPSEPQLSPLASLALASIYYSNQNPDTTEFQRFVPDAGGYPLVQTLYEPSFNDRVYMQGGAGPRLQLSDSNVITNYYVSAEQQVMNALFGLNVGWSNYYNKTVSRDPNMQLSLSVKDYEGKQMYTALIGRGGNPFDHALSTDAPDSTRIREDILYGVPQEIIGLKRIADKEFFNDAEANDSIRYVYTFDPYPVCPGQSLSVKAHYDYDVTDQCGDTVASDSGTLGYTGVVSTAVSFSGSANMMHLGQAAYSVHKELTVNTGDIAAAVDSFFAAPPNCFHDEPWFIRKSVESRKFPCPAVSDNPCDLKKKKMIEDMYPEGKYGGYRDSSGYIVSTGTSVFTIHRATVHWDPDLGGYVYDTSGGLPIVWVTHYTYQDSCVLPHIPDTLTIGGIQYYHIRTMRIDSFIMVYNLAISAGNDSIAEALLPLHPEYCALKACMYDTFKIQLLALPDAATAEQRHLLHLDSIIAHDPLVGMLSGSGYDSLSTFRGGNVRLDFPELIRAYCGCSDSVMMKECASHIFHDEIMNRLLVNDYVKRVYFKDMRDLYLMNRQRFVDNLTVIAGGDSCNQCEADRLPPTGDIVFDHGITSSGGISTRWIDSAFASGDSTGAWVISTLSSGSFYSDSAALHDSAITIWSRADSAMAFGAVDSIVARLSNCGNGDTAIVHGIGRTLDSICATHMIHAGNFTPEIIRYAIVRNHASVNDFCNEYLVKCGPIPSADETSQACLTDSFYANVATFLNADSILKACIFPGTVHTYVLDYVHNLFENKIYSYIGSSATVKAYATYDPANTLYTLNLVNASTLTDTARVYLRGTGSCDSTFFGGQTGDNIVISSVQCSSAVPSSPRTGFINEFSFVANVTDLNMSTGVYKYCVLLGWTDSMQTMADRNSTISNCVPCTQMRKLFTQFADSMTAWGVVGSDHPLYEKMLLHFMNYNLNQWYSVNQYETFIQSCALADSMLMPLYVGYSNFKFLNSADADSFIRMLNAIDTEYTFNGIFRDSANATGNVMVSVDLSIPPSWELFKYKNAIRTYAGPFLDSNVNAPLSRFEGVDIVGSIYAYPGTTSLTTSAVFGSGGTITITPAGSRGIWMGTRYEPQDYYYVHYVPGTTPAYEVSRAVYELKRYIFNNEVPAIFVSNFHSTVNADYYKPHKQDYLKYTYGNQALPPYRVLDSVQAANLKLRVTGLSYSDVSYTHPFNPNVVTNLYISDSTMNNRYFDTLKVILDQVATLNTVSPAHIFFDTNKVTVTSSLMAYRCSDGTYWYRYFAHGDTLFNVYVAMPPWIPKYERPHYHVISMGPPPFVMSGLGDSTTRFFTLNLAPDAGGPNIQARGMTTFVIGKNIELDNVLLGQPITAGSGPERTDTFHNCERDLLNSGIRQGKVDYINYMDSLRRTIQAGFAEHVMSHVREQLILDYQFQQFGFTLYNYDRAGNLTATVPPAGVNRLPFSGILNLVDTSRADCLPVSSGYLPGHTKVSSYNYNSLNQVVSQNTPDGGTTQFFYDANARLIFSQNAKQAPNGYCTYNLYDHQNRIIETGEAKVNCPYFDEYDLATYGGIVPVCHYIYPGDAMGSGSIVSPYSPVFRRLKEMPHDSVIYYIHSMNRKDVVMTMYDTAAMNLALVPGMDAQENLRKRVTAVKYFKNCYAADPYFLRYDYCTHYSYDIDGNVKNLVQDFPALNTIYVLDTARDSLRSILTGSKQRFKRVDYDYDLISGKVTMLSYNRGFADQYYQRYAYDDDNRITRVETSGDGFIWHRDAEYAYYEHGPLARIDVGDLRIQGIDYAYTIQGWLKAMNGDTLKTTMDMGEDGSVTINAQDAVAYSVDYFKNDYKPITAWQMKHVADESRSLYNGNISRQTEAIATFQRLNKQYAYDQLNRIKTADYATVSALDNSLTSVPDFQSRYSYDLDGNLLTLKRNGNNNGSGVHLMDSLIYNYGTGTGGFSKNQIRNLVEAAPNMYSNDAQYNLPGAATTPNYEYDEIGNVKRDALTGDHRITWNLYNKVTDVSYPLSSTTLRHDLWFDYDGAGNRVGKHYGGYYSGYNVWMDEYYVHDAQGNILAVYKGTNQHKLGLLPWVADVHFTLTGGGGGGGVVSSHGYDDFLLHDFGTTASFRSSVIAYAMANSSFKAIQLSRPPSYFMNASDLFYRQMVNADANYVMPLVAYEKASIDTIMGPSLWQMSVQQPQKAIKMLGWLYADTMTRLHTLDLLCTANADSLVADVALALAIDTTVMCDTMKLLLATQPPASVAEAVVNASVRYPAKFNEYLRLIARDSIIFSDSNFARPDGAYIGLLKNAVADYGAKSKVVTFLQASGQGNNMVSHIASDQDLMEIVYNTDTRSFLYAMDSLMGPSYFDTAVASDPYFRPEAFASRVSGTIGATTITTSPPGYIGLVLDQTTFGLAEHDIYGSSRLGIKKYLPSQIGFSWNLIDSTADTVRLWEHKPWYSQEYQDVIKQDSLKPYGNTHTDHIVATHLTGQKEYELVDHLGDVLATLSDARLPFDTTTPTLISAYKPIIQSAFDYYPFGMYMPGRHFTDSLPHCVTLSETKLVRKFSTTWYPWTVGTTGLGTIGGATITSTGSDVLVSAGGISSGSRYTLSHMPLHTPIRIDFTVDSATIGWSGTIVQDDTMVLANFQVTAFGPATYSAVFTASTTDLHLDIISASQSGHIGISGHTIVDTDYVPTIVLTNECSNDEYRYGYNGQMKTNEWAGIGNHTTALFWEYDSRTGRRANIDPEFKKFPNLSPYATNRDNPIGYNDPKGDCPLCALVGGVIGGASNYIGQVTSNLSRGEGWKSFTKVDVADVILSTGEGALAGLTLGASEAFGRPAFGAARALVDWKPGDDSPEGGLKVVGGNGKYNKKRSEVAQDLLSEGMGLAFGGMINGGGVGKGWESSGITQGRTLWTNVNDPKRIWKFGLEKGAVDAVTSMFGGIGDAAVKEKVDFNFLNRAIVIPGIPTPIYFVPSFFRSH